MLLSQVYYYPKKPRHNWLRLTPAYSHQLVAEELRPLQASALVLDPFAGTGTTGLVAASKGLNAVLLDINPFLIWRAKAIVMALRRCHPEPEWAFFDELRCGVGFNSDSKKTSGPAAAIAAVEAYTKSAARAGRT